MTTATTLTTGRMYDTCEVEFAGWSTGEEHIDGYSVWDYFDAAGRYLGPDADGIEPLFADEGRGMRYKVSDGTITYVCDAPDGTTPREVAEDFAKGYDTNREPITDVDVCVMDEDGEVLVEATLDIVPDDSPSFDYCG